MNLLRHFSVNALGSRAATSWADARRLVSASTKGSKGKQSQRGIVTIKIIILLRSYCKMLRRIYVYPRSFCSRYIQAAFQILTRTADETFRPTLKARHDPQGAGDCDEILYNGDVDIPGIE